MPTVTAPNLRTVDLNLLRVFYVVMAARNLTRAAERLSITQLGGQQCVEELEGFCG